MKVFLCYRSKERNIFFSLMEWMMTDISANSADFESGDSARQLRKRLMIGLGIGVTLCALAYGGYAYLLTSA
jgi:hypothetical protein